MFTLKTEQSTQDCDFACQIMLLKENFLIRRLIILEIDFSMILCGLSKVPASVTYILASPYPDPNVWHLTIQTPIICHVQYVKSHI